MLFHFGRGNSVELGDSFVDHHRRGLQHRRRHESGRYSRHSPSLGTGSSSQRVAFGCTRGFDTCPAVLPSMIAVPDDARSTVHHGRLQSPRRDGQRIGRRRAGGDGRDRNDDGDRDRVAIARLPSRLCPRQFSSATLAARFKLSSSPRHARPSDFDAGHELVTKSRTLAGSLLRPRFARRSTRHSGFPSDAAALRPAEASAATTASESATAATADDVGAGASDDGTDNSSRATVRTLGQACSTQTPWRLRSAGFASVDSPFASHKIHGHLDAGRR